MRSLIGIVSALMVAFSIVLAVMIGATYRDTNRFAYLFTKPDGSKCETPCLLGVDDLDLSLEAIDRILQSHPALQQARREVLKQNTVVYHARDFIVSFGNSSKNRRWVGVLIYFDGNGRPLHLTLFDLMMLIGAPDSIPVKSSSNAADDCAFLEFHVNKHIYHVAPVPHMETAANVCANFGQEISSMSLDDVDLSTEMKMTKWRGFAPYEYYLNK